MKKPCKFAVDNGAGWECTNYRTMYCAEQKFDYNPDGSINIVICCLLDTIEKLNMHGVIGGKNG